MSSSSSSSRSNTAGVQTLYYVFSTAGKLVYASNIDNDEHAHEHQHDPLEDGDGDGDGGDAATTHVGVLQTLISIFHNDGADRLRHLTFASSSSGAAPASTTTTSLVFLLRPPLYLTAICTSAHSPELHPPPALLRIHLDALHLQLTSIVPAPKLHRLFAQRPNYDLRARMLAGTEPFLHRLIASLDLAAPPRSLAHNNTGTEGGWPWLLGALQPIKMDPALRAQLGSALQPPPAQPSRQSRSSASSAAPAPGSASQIAAAAAAPTEAPSTASSSLISSVGTVTASTLSLLNPASYLAPASPTLGSSSSSANTAIPSHPPPRPRDLLYVLVLFRSQLVTLLRPRKHSVHAADMHLLINAARASVASRAKEKGARGEDAEELQSWVPVCLPRFAPGGFVWAHVSLLPTNPSAAVEKAGAQSTSTNDPATPRRPGLPAQHGSAATITSTASGATTGSASASANPMHVVVDGLPSTQTATTTATAQAVAHAMRSSLRPSSSSSNASASLALGAGVSGTSSRAAPPMPSAAHIARRTHLIPTTSSSSTSLSSLSIGGRSAASASASQKRRAPRGAQDEAAADADTDTEADRRLQASEAGDITVATMADDAAEDDEADAGRGGAGRTRLALSTSVSHSETASLAETETETEADADGTLHRSGGGEDEDGDGEDGSEQGESGAEVGEMELTMDEEQERELMASISALRTRPAATSSSTSAAGRKAAGLLASRSPTQGVEPERAGEQKFPSEASTPSPPQAGDGPAQRGKRVAYADEADELTLVLVSGDPEAFGSLSLWRTHILRTLSAPSPSSSSSSSKGASSSASASSSSILDRLVRATSGLGSRHPGRAEGATDEAGMEREREKRAPGYSADELRVPGLRHFIYKSRTATQLTAPRFEPPYLPDEEEGKSGGGNEEGTQAWRRLIGLYGLAWEGLHGPAPPDPELFGLDLSGKAVRPAAAAGRPDDSISSVDADKTPAEPGRGAEVGHVQPVVADAGEREGDALSSADAPTTTTAADAALESQSPNPKDTDNPRLLLQTKLIWTTSTSTYTFLRTPHEAVLAWLTSSFELYICVSPWMRRKVVVGNVANKVAKWVKQEEEALFLLAPPVF